MSNDLRLHETMDAIATQFPPLSSADVLARGVRYQRRRRAALVASSAAVLATGAVLAFTQWWPGAGTGNPVLPATSQAPNQTPTTAPPPSASSSAPIISGLAPAERFVKGSSQTNGAAVTTNVVDKALDTARYHPRELRLIKVTDQHSIPTVDPDQPTPQPTVIAGTTVYIGPNGTLMEANWIHSGVRYVLQWDTLPEIPKLTDADIHWIVEQSLSGRL